MYTGGWNVSAVEKQREEAQEEGNDGGGVHNKLAMRFVDRENEGSPGSRRLAEGWKEELEYSNPAELDQTELMPCSQENEDLGHDHRAVMHSQSER